MPNNLQTLENEIQQRIESLQKDKYIDLKKKFILVKENKLFLARVQQLILKEL